MNPATPLAIDGATDLSSALTLGSPRLESSAAA
jgi:hypothetical protein